MRTVLSVPAIKDMREAQTFEELWRFLNNDQGYELRQLYASATGRSLGSFYEHATDEDWPAMRLLIDALEEVVGLVDRALHEIDWEDRDLVLRTVKERVLESPAVKADRYKAAVADSLLTDIRMHIYDLADVFDEKLLVNARELKPLKLTDTSEYDVFVSYKTARHAERAAALARRLQQLGYRVWFDQDVLEEVKRTSRIIEKDYLVAILEDAVARSRCTILFEAANAAVLLVPGLTEEEALARRLVMKDRRTGALVAWDWQKLEIDATRRGIAIHPTTLAIFDGASGDPVELVPYADEQDFDRAIAAALRTLGVEAPPR